MKSYIRNARISPRKMQVIAAIVRNMDAKQALDTLRFMPQKGALILYKGLHSAVANAEHNDMQDKNNLTIESLVVGKGIVYKRFNPVSRGRAHPIKKRTSNVSITLSVK